MRYPLVITNGTLVTATASFAADIAVDGEQIVAIGRNLTGEREIDATGKLVTPGAVDIHVHHEMALGNGVVSADDFFTGTRAAALGGTTAIVDFVEPHPEQSLLDGLAERRAAADPKVVIDYGLHMTISPREIAKLDQCRAAVAAGCATFKLYMAYGFRLHDGELLQALQAIKAAGALPVVHAENWDVINVLIDENLAAGRTAPHWHPRSRPALTEGEAAGRLIDLAELVGVPVHIFHVSCAEVVQRITAARARGLPVTGETCPQYLFLTWDAYDAPGVQGALPVCSPPIRGREQQQALWQALAHGHLHVVTTDHCPFALADKARGLGNFRQIPGGVPSIEMRFAGLYQGVVRGLYPASRWVELCCTAPARLAGFQRKGDLAIGYDADLVIFDPQRQITLSPAILHEQCDWTPYDGLALTGWPETVLSRGEVIVEGGVFRGEAGRGRFVGRERRDNG
jgi:dihydropyrimidinase